MCLARRIQCFLVSTFLHFTKIVNFAQSGLALDVSDHDFFSVWRERQVFCTFNETLLFLGWREAELAQTDPPKKIIDVMPFGNAFSTKHNEIRGGVEGVIHCIPVVSQHGKGAWRLQDLLFPFLVRSTESKIYVAAHG